MKLCSSSLRRSNVSFLHLVLFKYSAFSQEHKVHLCKYYNIWMSRLFCVERFMTWCYELSLQMKVIHVSQSTAGFFGGRHQPDPGIKHRTSRLCISLIIIWFWNSLILWVLLYLNTNNYFVFCSFVQPWTRWKFWVFDLWSIPGAAQLTVGLSAENPQIWRKPLELSVNQPGPALCLQADRRTRWALDKQSGFVFTAHLSQGKLLSFLRGPRSQRDLCDSMSSSSWREGMGCAPVHRASSWAFPPDLDWPSQKCCLQVLLMDLNKRVHNKDDIKYMWIWETNSLELF